MNITCSFTYEFAPSASAAILAAVDFAQPGIATDDAIANMIKSFPQIQNMSDSESMALSRHLRACSPQTHNQLIKCLAKYEYGTTSY
jgi:hypothetical protein